MLLYFVCLPPKVFKALLANLQEHFFINLFLGSTQLPSAHALRAVFQLLLSVSLRLQAFSQFDLVFFYEPQGFAQVASICCWVDLVPFSFGLFIPAEPLSFAAMLKLLISPYSLHSDLLWSQPRNFLFDWRGHSILWLLSRLIIASALAHP